MGCWHAGGCCQGNLYFNNVTVEKTLILLATKHQCYNHALNILKNWLVCCLVDVIHMY